MLVNHLLYYKYKIEKYLSQNWYRSLYSCRYDKYNLIIPTNLAAIIAKVWIDGFCLDNWMKRGTQVIDI